MTAVGVGDFILGMAATVGGGYVLYLLTLHNRKGAARGVLRGWLDSTVADLRQFQTALSKHHSVMEKGGPSSFVADCSQQGLPFLPYILGHFPDVEQFALAHALLVGPRRALDFVRLMALVKRIYQHSEILKAWSTTPSPPPATAHATDVIGNAAFNLLRDLNTAEKRAADLDRATADWRRHVPE